MTTYTFGQQSRILEVNGWELKRGKGTSHRTFKKDGERQIITIVDKGHKTEKTAVFYRFMRQYNFVIPPDIKKYK